MLLFLLLMNLIGYYGIFVGLGIRNDSIMVQRLDADRYETSETVTIKIPITLPYAPDRDVFERVDGKFEYQGEFYRLVKQKFSKDTLTVICVRDKTEKNIQHALVNYVRTFGENQLPGKAQTKFSISFVKDYILLVYEINKISDGWVTDVLKNGSLNSFIASFSSSIIHPPERL